MSQNRALIEKATAAWQAKDEATMRACLHRDHYFKGPMVEARGQDEYIAVMLNFPFASSNQNDELIADGDKVVHAFDWVVTAPFKATIPMVEVFDVADAKIKKTRLFFDTALFPDEIRQRMMRQ